MRILIILTALAVFTSCTKINSGIETVSKVNDQALHAAEFTICKGASVGSIRRNYGSKERAELWRQLCTGYGQEDNFSPIID